MSGVRTYEELRARQLARKGLIGGHWTPELVEYKQALCEYAWFLKFECNTSYEEIGRRLGCHKSTANKYAGARAWQLIRERERNETDIR